MTEINSAMWRDVFVYSINPEVYLDADNIRGLLPHSLPDSANTEEQIGSLQSFVDNTNKKWEAAFFGTDNVFRTRVMHAMIEQTAPIAASIGVPLQGLSAPGVFEDPIHLRLIALLAEDIGVGSAERWRFDLFREIARSQDITSITGTLRELSGQRNIRDGCFRLPALIYAMSRRSDEFDCELIGLDFAWRSVGLLPVWRLFAKEDCRWSKLDLCMTRGAALKKVNNLADYSAEVIRCINRDSDAEMRIVSGIKLFETLISDLDSLLFSIHEAVYNPRLAMAILVQDRAREAKLYHSNFKLEGRLLSDWFQIAQSDPMPLVDAISRSKLVRKDKPERSLLINGLLRPDGAMFRIFTDVDINIIRRWIETLDVESLNKDTVNKLPARISLQKNFKNIASGDLELGEWPLDIRSAYHLLQRRALQPRMREFAQKYSSFWLERSYSSVDKTDRSLPKKWRPGQLREWLLASHDSHAQDYNFSKNGDMPSREEVIDQTLQLAPMTLIDGAWLQGFTDVALAASRVGAPLFETYWDELGNGDWSINHPKIYRDVLAAMDISLPPTGSRDFVNDMRLHDVSFRLPVYWLCLGKQPVSLRPEILGMNLAMELSGVGGTYRNAHKFLKHYGFPTIFVDLHNTIDNVSTGHSAWAADAIDSYMLSTQELVPQDQSWSRIRLGYESLSPIVDDQRQLDFFSDAQSTTGQQQPLGGLLHHRPLQCLEAVA